MFSCGIQESPVILGIVLLQVLIEINGVRMLEQDGGEEGGQETIGKIKVVVPGVMSQVQLTKDDGK